MRKRRVRASSRGGGSGGERKGEGGYVSSGYESSASTGSCICNHAEVGGGNDTAKTRRGVRLSGTVAGADMESVLRDGRVQALIEGLWTKVVRTLLQSITELGIVFYCCCYFAAIG